MSQEKKQDESSVYVVDDGEDYRLLVQQVFARFLPAYSVSLFPDGSDLLNHLERSMEHPALILLDMYMPVLNGLQTLEQLKRQPSLKLIPVVIVTSASSAEEIQACYEAGANSCLAKPVGLESMRYHLTLICDYWVEVNRLGRHR